MKDSNHTSQVDEFYIRSDKHDDGPSEKSVWTKSYQLHSASEGLHRSDRAGQEESDHRTSKPVG